MYTRCHHLARVWVHSSHTLRIKILKTLGIFKFVHQFWFKFIFILCFCYVNTVLFQQIQQCDVCDGGAAVAAVSLAPRGLGMDCSECAVNSDVMCTHTHMLYVLCCCGQQFISANSQSPSWESAVIPAPRQALHCTPQLC